MQKKNVNKERKMEKCNADTKRNFWVPVGRGTPRRFGPSKRV